MPIQFIPNEDHGGALGSVGEYLQLMQRNQLVQLQSKQLDLQAQKQQLDAATQGLINQKVQSELDDKKSVDEYISSMADEHVDNSMPGAPDGYRILAKGQIKNYATMMAAQHIEQTKTQTQALALENQQKQQVLAQNQALFNAQAPFLGPNAILQNRQLANQVSTAEQSAPLQQANQIVSLNNVFSSLDPQTQQDILEKNPQLGKMLVQSGGISFNQAMKGLAENDPKAAAQIMAAQAFPFNPHEIPTGFDEKTGLPTYQSQQNREMAAKAFEKSLTEKFSNLKDKTGGGSGKGPATQPTAQSKNIDATAAVAQQGQTLRENQKTIDQHIGYFQEFESQMRPAAGGGGLGAGFYYNPAASQDWSQPPKHFQGKGYGDYSKAELQNIFSISSTPDATSIQAARVNFLLDKIIQSDNPKVVKDAYVQNGGSLTPQQDQQLNKLAKLYKWW